MIWWNSETHDKVRLVKYSSETLQILRLVKYSNETGEKWDSSCEQVLERLNS